MSKGSGKRKCEDEISLMEINNPHKRLKLEDIIFHDISLDQENIDKPIKNTVTKRRYKLLTAVHLKKKYKYYCKKHDVTYLIESVRKETKDLSKKSRDNFVQSFRDLSVSINFQNVEEEKVKFDTDKNIDVPNIDMELDVENRNEWLMDETSSSSNTTPLRRCSTNSDLVLDENDDSYFKVNAENSWSLPEEIKNRFAAAAANFMDKTNFSDEEEHTDSSDDRCKSKHKKAKVVKCLIVTKLPGTNQLLFRETDDVIESGIEDDPCDGNADCDCSDHEDLRRKFLNCEYESSLDADDSDSFSGISEDR